MNPPLKVFSPRNRLPADRPYCALLFPFWGKIEDPRDPSAGRFDEFIDRASNWLALTDDIAAADVVVAPCEWLPAHAGTLQSTRALLAEARSAEKPLAVFFNHDSSERLPFPDALVFRTSFFRSRRGPLEFALPAWSEDLRTRYTQGTSSLRSHAAIPVVSFCGQAVVARSQSLLLWTKLRFLHRGNPGNLIRGRAIRRLRSQPGLRCQFIVREQFWGGALAGGMLTQTKAARNRAEFAENLLASDYALCVRGAGNFSYRLYEALCLGRIPLLVDTDCVLPFDRWIDWKKCCVWIDESDLGQIGERVVEFHRSLSPEAYVERQEACRRLWEDWLSPQGFFANFWRFFCSEP